MRLAKQPILFLNYKCANLSERMAAISQATWLVCRMWAWANIISKYMNKKSSNNMKKKIRADNSQFDELNMSYDYAFTQSSANFRFGHHLCASFGIST